MKRLIQIALFAGIQHAFAQQLELLRPHHFSSQKIEQEWIYVKFKTESNVVFPGNSLKSLSQADQVNKLKVLKLKVPEGKDPITFCNELRKSGQYLYADPIVQYQPLSIPSDPLINNQYYLANIQVEKAWDITTGDDDITIGIIDSGLDLDHEDLINNLWQNIADPIDGEDNDGNGYIDDFNGYDFADVDNDPNIENGNHGMIVGGIAGASTNNGKGIAGVGYNTKVAALKGFKSTSGNSNGLYEAIIYAADNGIDVVNLSWGRMGLPLQSEQDIIDYAVLEKDVIVIAAAGNEGGKSTEENMWYPASYNHVISVGASDADDMKSTGSTFNYAVDLVAPGVSMFSTIGNGGYANGGPGTSYSAPQVAAAAALVKDQFPDLSAIQIMERVRSTADDIYDIGTNSIYDGKLGKGRLNIFRAVSESNVKALKSTNLNLTSYFGTQIFFGDTVEVTAELINILAPINSPLISISSPENDFSISEETSQPGFLNTGDTAQVSFEIILNDDILPESNLDIRLDYAATGYTDFQFLEITTSPNYVDFGNDNMFITISGNGNLGFDSYSQNFVGAGFQYELDTLIIYTGLMLATNSASVSDNIIANYSSLARNQDFSVQKNYKLYHHPGADHFGYSEFSDTNHQLIIEQSNITWNSEDFIIIRYRIVNNSESPIHNLSFGIFADWDLGNKLANYAEYDSIDNYIYARNESSNQFAGVQIIGGVNSEYSALDMNDLNGNSKDIDVIFSDDLKYDFLVNQEIQSAGSMGAGNDVATINGVTIDTLSSYDETFVNVIYSVANSKENLKAELLDAQEKLDEFLQKPRLLEKLFTCDGSSIIINPVVGNNYEFFSDPLGQNLITAGSELNATNLSSDTSFYVKNIDENYPSDIFEIRVNLFAEIADFEMSTDTLYLDHPTTNVVQFTDQSIDAISWSWDFGQGTSSSLQNPLLSFSEAGTYTINLSIENAQGCVDSLSKNLVVANRPSPPSLSDVIICPGEDVLLNDPTADRIQVYAFEDQTEPSASGSNVTISSIQKDTTIYLSGIYNSFESLKTILTIDVMEVNGKILSILDTLSEQHQIMITAAEIDAEASIQWHVNGNDSGSEGSIQIPATSGSTDITLTITDTNGCTNTLMEVINVSTSPFASQQDVISCNRDSVVIKPSNGVYFGFYEDVELTQFIKKGTQLKTNSYDKLYIVGLDDGLPGMPIEVNIQNENPHVEINYTSETIGNKNQVTLSTESTVELVTYEWFLNGDPIETTANPTIFLDNELYEITLQSHSAIGCLALDTLFLDFIPPLSIGDKHDNQVYPNPTNGLINFKYEKIKHIEIYQLDGRLVEIRKVVNKEVDISHLKKGLYLIKVYSDQAPITHQVLLRPE
ncbi:S8 family serine peptidase [Ekhidna sp.]|uniref:S8 family serine peptidase n=1 Tax=Ekhidna sp. TaxID=2608089 RepID=UPI003299335B